MRDLVALVWTIAVFIGIATQVVHRLRRHKLLITPSADPPAPIEPPYDAGPFRTPAAPTGTFVNPGRVLLATQFAAMCPTCGGMLTRVHFKKQTYYPDEPGYMQWTEEAGYACGTTAWMDGCRTASTTCPTTLPKCKECQRPVQSSPSHLFCRQECAAAWAEKEASK